MDDDGLCREKSGTMGYMAPEIMHKKPHGPASDAWAIGAVAIEFLTTKRLSEHCGGTENSMITYFKEFKPDGLVENIEGTQARGSWLRDKREHFSLHGMT